MNIAIDLTPLLPGSSNGGAKIMILSLIKEMAEIAPKNRFHLFVSQNAYTELLSLESHNVSLINITSNGVNNSLSRRLYQSTKKLLPKRAIAMLIKYRSFIKAIVYNSALIKKILMNRQHHIQSSNSASGQPESVKFDLLFCPFTAPYFYQFGVPIVSIVYDLQSHYYPFFFTRHEQIERKRNFDDAIAMSSRIICISDYVRETTIKNANISPDKVKTIYIRTANRLPKVDIKTINSTLESLGLFNNEFLLYPANFWKHKNHKMLLTAFNIYKKSHSNSKLKLVCTGADCSNKEMLQKNIDDMSLTSQIILPGYLSEKEFSALMMSCKTLIYPSLYEGFGMPPLEAMSMGKPVLCSNTTSLPEITKDAALFFDPTNPHDIAGAIARIESDDHLANQLVCRGYLRYATFANSKAMAQEYLDTFQAVMNTHEEILQ